MKVMIDKIEKPPHHALARSDVWALLRAVPAEWLNCVGIVHLCATLPSHSRFDRPVILGFARCNGRLNVCSRGLSPAQARVEILRELAARQKGLCKMYNHLSRQELMEVDRMVAPVLARIESEERSAQTRGAPVSRATEATQPTA